MHTNILNKCLTELSSESPRLDYVRGMLETLIEMQETKGYTYDTKLVQMPIKASTPPTTVENPKDAGDVLNDVAAAKLAQVKAMSEKMTA